MAKGFSIFSEIAAINKASQVFREVVRDLRPLARAAKDIGGAWGGAFKAGQKFGRELRNVAAAGLVAGGAAFAMAQQSAAAADGITDAADKLGIGVEQFQELRYAADQAGVGANNLETGLQRLNRRIVDAAGGKNQELAGLFGKLGIDVRDANGNIRTSADLLPELADGFRNNANAALRTKMAFALFDSEGVDLVRMLTGGSAGLADMRQEARDLGIVVSEDLVRAASQFDDQFGGILMTLKSLAMEITGHLSPAMGDATAALQAFIAEHRTDIIEGAVSAFEAIGGAVRGIAAAVQFVAPHVQTFVDWIGGWEVAGAGLAALFGGALVVSLVGFLVAVGGAIAATVAALASVAGLIALALAAIGGAAAAVYVYWDEIKAYFSGLWDSIAGDIQPIIDAAKAVGGFLADPVGSAASGVRGLFGGGATAAALPGAGQLAGGGRQRGEMTVRFENMPRGARVETGRTDNLDLEMETGLSMAGTSAG